MSGTSEIGTLEARHERLYALLRELESVVVAYSGGVDSTYLLSAALEALGPSRVLAVTAISPTYPASEREASAAIARQMGARQRFVHTEELDDPRFAENPPERCYYCKSHLFQDLHEIACGEGLQHVVYGATQDDLGDHRPGMQAAREMGARAPLLEAGLTKEDVRTLSREAQLPTWDKPAMACLASRFPYHQTITGEALARVEQAEDYMRDEIGLRQVRVRDYGPLARLEVEPSAFGRLMGEALRERVVAHLKSLGYAYVTLDMEGFRSGSMNRVLATPEGDRMRS